MTPETCPNCGADVPRGAKACPECGSDEETGWSEEAQSQTGAVDIPEENFDYDDFVKREFGGKQAVPRGIAWYWWVVAIVLVILFALFWLR